MQDLTYPYTPLQPDAYKSDGELYQSNGYRFEEHKILTEDGYILTAFRIPGKITDSMKDLKNRPPIILQHGLLDNSATWTINYFNMSLPYLLLEEGYDVWITNTRGNFNSYEHKNPKDYSIFVNKSKYWNFTLDEMAIYDLPANIEYILDYTNNEKLSYVGHSQGTAQFFAANCLHSLADKVDVFIGLGPVLYVNHMESPLAKLALLLHSEWFLNHLSINNILVWPKIVNVELKGIVNRIKRTLWRFIQLICGVTEEITVDIDRMPVLGRHEPGGTSLLNFKHWMQLMKSGKLQRFDYGEQENIRIYGQPTPPLYDIDALTKNLKDMDMFLIRGGADALVAEIDFNLLVDTFKDKTPGTLKTKVIPGFGHLDYVWALAALEEVYMPVIEFLRQARNK